MVDGSSTGDAVVDPVVPDDRALLAAHVAGDPDAFGELVRRHRDRLWAVALRTIGDREDAADAVQNALVSAFRNASSYRGDAAVSTWLHRIVVNACLDLVRRRSVRPADPLPDDEARHPADPRDAIGSRVTSIVVEEALATLPVEQRAAIVLVDVQGYSVEEAAQILECAPGTVKSRCSRGRARLLPLLAHLRNPDGGPHVPPGRTEATSPTGPTTSSTATGPPGSTGTTGTTVEGGQHG
jgi:RNA polymerase sigma-70 factor (ECF subfamily)